MRSLASVTNRLGKTIRILRQAKALKLNELALDSGVSVSFLSLVENGERQPSLDVIRRLSKSLGVPPEALVLMGMGEKSDLESENAEANELTETIDRLMDIEKKLARLLDTETTSATKRRIARGHRRGDGTRPR
jgi:transcriptional regulator with XRE-family HTH domain